MYADPVQKEDGKLNLKSLESSARLRIFIRRGKAISMSGKCPVTIEIGRNRSMASVDIDVGNKCRTSVSSVNLIDFCTVKSTSGATGNYINFCEFRAAIALR